MPFSQVLFEILSAYGTCGLSLGFESGPSVTNIATKEVRLFAFFFTDTQTHETPAASGIKPSLSVESGVGPSKVDVFSENLETWSRSELRVANHFLFYIFLWERK